MITNAFATAILLLPPFHGLLFEDQTPTTASRAANIPPLLAYSSPRPLAVAVPLLVMRKAGKCSEDSLILKGGSGRARGSPRLRHPPHLVTP